ncbi:WXG100 family type VII secretion target [Mycobacterium sp. OTB74]|jgi:WXG100 family type VII secretion target|uniref:WXG100 family type VII secretion target n=1 Tax=Mycobacterium sp. OTB74 TaxID=1853452 RepID=UPI0024755876|nr:WXG100 family type VII secretion target [Mycobacterium sp. OTB74]MDH6244720.1 WXG100 family type VII secretion target [Mycobacterium sp. OTB74]
MTAPESGALNADFDQMAGVSTKIDGRNEEIRAMLGSFIGQMTAIPPTVWGGAAATRFQDVVNRWNTESIRLHASLQRIAETIRANAESLRYSAEAHSQRIGATGHTI